jgi:D-3-phosphoglycerate dehydrogenase
MDAPEAPDWAARELNDSKIDLVMHNCSNSEELSSYAGDADVVWVFGGGRVITSENIGVLQRCGAIIRTGSGTDNIPVEHATSRGILVVNTPEAVSDAVSDHVVGLLFALGRQIVRNDKAVRAGLWEPKRIWPGWQVSHRILGLIGFGNVGRSLVTKLRGFDLSVLAYDPYVEPGELSTFGVRPATLPEVLRDSDFVSIHCPLTKETRHMIGEAQLRLMKPSALLINTSRGSVIDEQALLRALNENWIAGAGLDVLETEPPRSDHPLFEFDQVVLTPHVAGFSQYFWDNMWRLSVESVLDLAKGRYPRSYVNRQVQPRWKLSARGPERADPTMLKGSADGNGG